MIKPLSALASVALLAACTTTATPPAPSSAPPVSTINASVTAGRALQVLQNVCGSTLPRFSRAQTQMARVGITETSASGTVFSINEDLSAKIVGGGPEQAIICSIVWGSDQSLRQTRRTIDGFRTLVDGPLGLGAAYADDVLMIFRAPSTGAGRRYYNLYLLSGRT